MRIKSIKVKDFLSIESLFFTFTDGLHLFSGDNGAGKTTILQALQVGLYNKCDRPQPWARLDGPGGFIIEVSFISKEGKDIKTINNRINNRFEVYEDDILLSHQISKSLPMVVNMLNLNFSEFSMLSYLTPNTISSVLTGTDNSLISKFFSLDVLSIYDVTLREERKELTKVKKDLNKQLLKQSEHVSLEEIEALRNKLEDIKAEHLELVSRPDVQVTLVELKNDYVTKNIAQQEAEFTKNALVTQLDSLSTATVCPTCGSKLSTGTTDIVTSLIDVRKSIKESEVACEELTTSMHRLQTQITDIEVPYDFEVKELEDKRRDVDSKLIAANIIKEHTNVSFEEINAELVEIERKLYALNTAISAIKSGEVHKTYLETFTAVLNTNLGRMKDNLDLSMRVIAKIDSKGLSFSVLDSGIFKFSDILSAGEKVIVGLMVLTAMFEALGDTLNIKVSTIMLDEAIAAVGVANMATVEALLQNLAKDRCIIVTQHHEELPLDLFDYVNIVKKVNGHTEIN